MQLIEVPYNSQRDNQPFPNLRGSSQCGYTAAAMAISPFVPRSATDKFIAKLILAMEPIYGEARFEDRILRLVPWARGRRFGAIGDCYVVALNAIFAEENLPYRMRWYPTGGTSAQLKAAIDAGSPAMLSTMLTDYGHFITVIGYDDQHWICHDPYGDGYAPGGYRHNSKGEERYYPKAWLEHKARLADPNRRGLRFMHAERSRRKGV